MEWGGGEPHAPSAKKGPQKFLYWRVFFQCIFPYLEKDHQIDVSPLADVGGGAGGLWGGGLGVGHQGVGARPVEGGLGVEVLGGRRRRG